MALLVAAIILLLSVLLALGVAFARGMSDAYPAPDTISPVEVFVFGLFLATSVAIFHWV